MTADRVVVLVFIVVGIAVLTAFNRRKLARMSPRERAQFDINIAPAARFLKAFMWFWVIGSVVLAADAAIHGAWPVATAALVLAFGLGFGVAHRSRWWIGR